MASARASARTAASLRLSSREMTIPGLLLSVSDGDIPWSPTSHRGIYWLALHTEPGEGPRDSTVLIRMDPGCGYPAHVHVGVEEVLVLCGAYRDERGVHTAGSYVRYEAGSFHTPVALGDAARPRSESNRACILYAVARGGVRIRSDRAARGFRDPEG
jgi:anti-sigma factor ChrR (cupin superfamily)